MGVHVKFSTPIEQNARSRQSKRSELPHILADLRGLAQSETLQRAHKNEHSQAGQQFDAEVEAAQESLRPCHRRIITHRLDIMFSLSSCSQFSRNRAFSFRLATCYRMMCYRTGCSLHFQRREQRSTVFEVTTRFSELCIMNKWKSMQRPIASHAGNLRSMLKVDSDGAFFDCLHALLDAELYCPPDCFAISRSRPPTSRMPPIICLGAYS